MKKFSFIVLFLCCTSAIAGEVHKPVFAVEIPINWNEIPQDVLSKSAEEVKKKAPKAKYIKPDYGFQLGYDWLAYPYVLIEVKNLRKYSKKEFKSMEAIDIKKATEKINTNVSGALNDVTLGRPMYDEAANVIWIFTKNSIPNGSSISEIIGMIPTEYGVIQITGVSVSNDFLKYMPIFQKIIMSIKVDSSISYK